MGQERALEPNRKRWRLPFRYVISPLNNTVIRIEKVTMLSEGVEAHSEVIGCYTCNEDGTYLPLGGYKLRKTELAARLSILESYAGRLRKLLKEAEAEIERLQDGEQ